MMTTTDVRPEPTLTSVGASQRVPAADGLRGLAALAIVLHHSAFMSGYSFPFTLLDRLYDRLDVGVPVFFALSGFLLFRPYVARMVAAADLPDTRRFYRRRLLRIFPGYWVAFLIQAAFGLIHVYGVSGFFANLTLTNVYTENALSGITQAWSLATELAFYAILPLFAFWLHRRTKRYHPSQRLVFIAAACAGWIAVSILSRMAVFALDPGWERNWRFTVFANADYFAVGLLAAVLAVGRNVSVGFATLDARLLRRPWLWYLVGSLAFFVTATQLELPGALRDGTAEQELARQFGYMIVAVGFVVPACLGDARHLSMRFLSTRPLVFLGTVSYGLYLWHQIFLSGSGAGKGLLLRWMGWKVFQAPLIPMFVLASIGAIILGALSWYLIEKPMLKRFG